MNDNSTGAGFDPELSADEYLNQCRERWVKRLPIESPKTLEQLLALHRERPDIARRFFPPPALMRYLGLPAWFGRTEPLSECFQERFLLTMSDAQFVRALRTITRRAAG